MMKTKVMRYMGCKLISKWNSRRDYGTNETCYVAETTRQYRVAKYIKLAIKRSDNRNTRDEPQRGQSGSPHPALRLLYPA